MSETHNSGPEFQPPTSAEKFDAKTEDVSSEQDMPTPTVGEHVDADKNSDEPQPPLDQLSASVARAAQEAGYAVAGFASYVGEKARGFYDEQRKNYVAAHPEQAESQEGQRFLEQLQSQIGKLVEDATRAYRDFAERGRQTVHGRGAEEADANQAEAITDGETSTDGEAPRPS